jgi:SAM-dependent methyltransferase
MIEQFYDELAPFYHLIFSNWDASMQRQATILDRIIRREWGPAARTVLDVSCGIGTQAIALARLGYRVRASDLSRHAVRRARAEAQKRGVQITFSVADMRQAFEHHQREFDVLICCDNSLPHLLCDEDILQAFGAFYRCVKPGGGCLLSVRDYDAQARAGIQVKPYGIRQENGIRYLIFQVWEFQGPIYELALYLIEDAGSSQGTTRIFRTRYYAVSPNRVVELLQEAGFSQVRRIDDEYYQPVIVGSKPL